jgi:hypothetical protein
MDRPAVSWNWLVRFETDKGPERHERQDAPDAPWRRAGLRGLGRW